MKGKRENESDHPAIYIRTPPTYKKCANCPYFFERKERREIGNKISTSSRDLLNARNGAATEITRRERKQLQPTKRKNNHINFI